MTPARFLAIAINMLIKRKSIEHAKSTSRKPKYAPITLSEQDGVRFLHFGTEWIQGGMRLRKPDWLELEYSQQMMAWMLFIDSPQTIAQLGLGTGALSKFCYRQFPDAKIISIELNPAVIAIAASMFKLPPNDARLNVLEMDAHDFVNDPVNLNSLDVLQVDLYDAAARGPVLDTPEFYKSCAACLKPGGIMTVNLFGDHPSYAKNMKAMNFAFAKVLYLPEIHDGNVIALAFNQSPSLDLIHLEQRAREIKAATKLPTKPWIDGLKQALKIA